MRSLLIALLLIVLLGFSAPGLILAQGPRDRQLERIEGGVNELVEKQRQEEEAKRKERQREQAAKAKEEQRKVDEARVDRVEDSRATAARRRATECANQGACPSTSQDVRDQLAPAKR